jgi:hypothetical protein
MIMSGKIRTKTPAVLFLCLASGALIGAAWAFRLDDEQRRFIKKNLFELRELPFRALI